MLSVAIRECWVSNRCRYSLTQKEFNPLHTWEDIRANQKENNIQLSPPRDLLGSHFGRTIHQLSYLRSIISRQLNFGTAHTQPIARHTFENPSKSNSLGDAWEINNECVAILKPGRFHWLLHAHATVHSKYRQRSHTNQNASKCARTGECESHGDALHTHETSEASRANGKISK